MAQKLYRSRFTFEGQRYEKTSTKSQREADRKADQLMRDLENGNVGISGKMRVRVWANEWLETYKKPLIAEKQYVDYKSRIDNIILPAIGGLRLREVKDVHLQKILNSKAGYSYSRMHKLQNTISAMFRQAKVSRLIVFDPSEFLITPKAENGTHRSITDFEREHFLKAADKHHAGLMFKVMLYCGLRTGEVVALDWRDIDFKKQRIIVTRAMESGSSRIKEPKTEAGVRMVPIPDEIFDDLLAKKGNPFDPVFLQQRGKVRHTHSSRRNAWDSLKRQIDISMGAQFKTVEVQNRKKKKIKVLSVVANDFVPYCLRHTYCTDIQQKGVDIKIASYLMGHADISVTGNIYTHITDKAIENAAKLINGVTDRVTKENETQQTA